MPTELHDNVFFVGVARLAVQAMVIASLPYNLRDIDLGGVRQVLQQPNMNMSPGKHYSFNVDSSGMAWHLIADETGLIYLMITTSQYPMRTAHMALEELQRTFSAKFSAKASTAKERGLDSAAKSLLEHIASTYDDVAKMDKLSAVNQKLDAVKVTMSENIALALENTVKLDRLEAQAADLQQAAGVFKGSAKALRNKMWWQNIKMKLIIAFVILAILGIIIGVAVAVTKS